MQGSVDAGMGTEEAHGLVDHPEGGQGEAWSIDR